MSPAAVDTIASVPETSIADKGTVLRILSKDLKSTVSSSGSTPYMIAIDLAENKASSRVTVISLP